MEFDRKKSIGARRYATETGRYYGPTDMDILHGTTNPLKPSWTNVASIEASPGLSQWFKDKGRWADIDGPVSAIMGSIAHECVDHMNGGGIITTDNIVDMLENWEDMRWRLIYPNKWIAVNLLKKMLIQYCLWHKEHKPVIVESEIMLWHPDVPYAGTADLLLKIHNKTQKQDIYMLGDLKTGNENEKHSVQCMAYAMLVEKIYGIKVSAIGSLYCQGRWKEVPKPGKMKTKVIRNKNMEPTADAKFLADRVRRLYALWESSQTKPQPKERPKLPNEFQLKLNFAA